MNNRENGQLRTLLNSNSAVSTAAGVLCFLASGLFAFMIADLAEAKVWFSVIFSVAIGMLTFCAVRVWLDEEAFDDSNALSYVVLTGTLSFIAIILTYITLNVFPFGDHTVLIIDMHHQYVAFFSLLREKFFSVFSGGSLVYSDNIGLGGNFVALFAYYLSSPFNLLMLIFPRAAITEAIALATVLKITAAGVTFSIFAKRVFARNDFSVVIGGLAYSMISFFIGHSWNLMWLDPLILLPLICLGLELLLKRGKPALYCITLALALITNYYIAYMICIFMVLYYLAVEIGDCTRPRAEQRLRRFGRFCYGSLIGGGISAVIAVPAFISLMSTSGAEDQFARDLNSNFHIFSLFQRTLFSAYPSMRGDNLPNIYCSVLAVFLLVLFLVCDKIPLRRRVAWGGVVGFLAVSMSINWLNFAWHGFHFPNDLPYRFSFLMSFAMLCIAMQVLSNLSSISPRQVYITAGIVFAMLMLEQWMGDGFSDFTMIYGSLAFFAVYAALLALHASGNMRRAVCCALLLVFLFGEVAANASLVIQKLDSNEYFTERYDFVYDYELNKEVVEIVEGFDDDMYRSEIIPRKTCNDPSLFGYSGMTVFASSNRKSVTTLMGKMGYAVNGVNSYLYKNFSPVSDSVLGLKYLALSHSLGEHPQLSYTGQAASSEAGDRFIYQNTAALSKCYMVNNGIIGWTWQSENPFDVQNSFMTQATGCDNVYENIYIDASSDLSFDTSVEPSEAAAHSSASGYNCRVDINGSFFSMMGENGAIDSKFTIGRTIESDGFYSIYIDCRAANSINIRVNSANYTSTPTEPNVIDLGLLSAGTLVEVDFNVSLDSVIGNVFLAKLNEDIFNQGIADLQSRQLTEVTYREGRIEGKIVNEADGMMFTSIPYDGGWTVRVDGEKVDTFALGDALLCFAVPKGEHTVTLSFFPEGLLAGIIISAVSIFILVAMLVPALRDFFARLLAPVFGKFSGAEALPETGNFGYGADPRTDRMVSVGAGRYAEGVAQERLPVPEPPRDYMAEGFEAVDYSIFEQDFDGYEEYYDDQDQ